jgi:hypothetical protein
MKTAIAIGLLGLALTSNGAAAQTAVEQSQILRDFERSVVEYTQRHQCLVPFPEALDAATPAPKIFTLPVAMVFRQLIAQALADRAVAAIGGVGTPHRAVALQSFPTNELTDFPAAVRDALPPLPETLEYRLIGDDLVIRDTAGDLIVAVLRDAVGNVTTVRR